MSLVFSQGDVLFVRPYCMVTLQKWKMVGWKRGITEGIVSRMFELAAEQTSYAFGSPNMFQPFFHSYVPRAMF